MARIPSADGFGNVQTDAVKLDRRGITADSFGGGIGRAVQGIAMDAKREQDATRDAADRATAVRSVHAGRDSLAAAKDEIVELVRTGELPKEEAANRWQERSREISAAHLEGVSPKYAPDTQADIESQGARFTRDVSHAITQRNQSDVRSGLDSTFEAAQRLYMKDPAAANAMVDGAIAEFGPHSGLAPDQIAKAKQSWTENTRFTKAGELILGARRDNKALDKVSVALQGDEFTALDPQKKLQLQTQIEGFKVSNQQHAEAEARRLQAAREHQLKEAEAAYGAASSLVMTGKMLSPEYVAQVTKKTAGTPFADALPDLIKQAPERSAFGMQSLTVMDATISQARAQLNVHGTDPKIEKHVTELERIRDQAKKDYAEDPMLAAQERGIVKSIAPVNVHDVPSLLGTLAERTAQASLVSQQIGQPVSPLLKQEAETVGKMLNLLPVEQRSTAIAQLAQTVGPEQASALGRQMAPKDKATGIALGMAGDRTTAGRYTSELVLKGAQAIKDKAVKEDNVALTGIRARVAAEIGNAYPNQELRATMIEAATLAEYGLQSEGGGDPSRAVSLVTGGITERAGKKLPLPRGMSADDFDKKISTISPAALRTALPAGQVWVSGTSMKLDDFLKQVPQSALIHAGQGRYAVQSGTGIATNAAGVPLILEIN